MAVVGLLTASNSTAQLLFFQRTLASVGLLYMWVMAEKGSEFLTSLMRT